MIQNRMSTITGTASSGKQKDEKGYIVNLKIKAFLNKSPEYSIE